MAYPLADPRHEELAELDFHKSGSSKSIAAHFGISVATLQNWRRTPSYLRAYADFEQASKRRVRSKIRNLQKKAVDVLDAALSEDDVPWRERLSAASTVLRLAGVEPAKEIIVDINAPTEDIHERLKERDAEIEQIQKALAALDAGNTNQSVTIIEVQEESDDDTESDKGRD